MLSGAAHFAPYRALLVAIAPHPKNLQPLSKLEVKFSQQVQAIPESLSIDT